MKRLLTAALAVTLLIPSAAFAQDAGGMAPAAPPAGAGDGVNPAAADGVQLEAIIAALNDPQVEIGELSSIPADAQILVVDLNTYLQADGAATLIPAMAAAEGQRVAVQEALQVNSAIRAQLNSRDIDTEDVIGFGVDGSTILLFTNSSVGGNAGAGGAGVIERAP